MSKTIYLRPDAASQSVSVVSGGGSGHDPSFAAFVGPGLLSAAVSGTIFASPSAEQVKTCIQDLLPETTTGVLVVVMNYTGDVLNFGIAVEKARAAGVNVEMVVVGDDVGVGRAQGGKVGRRGIAGTVLVQKIAGALAAQGAHLTDVRAVATLVRDNVVSIGASLSHVHVPGHAPAAIDESEVGGVEIGMGIHNEPGSEQSTSDLPGVVKTMLKYMLDPNDEDRGFLDVSSSDQTVLLVNNLGGVSLLEMGGITNEVVEQLVLLYGIQPVRILSGTFMTSLNGMGFSVSLLKLQDTGLPQSMLDLLDAPSECCGWSAAIKGSTWTQPPSQTRSPRSGASKANQPCSLQFTDPQQVKQILTAAMDRVIAAEPEITRFDTLVGDGDCGTGLQRGAEAVLHLLRNTTDPPSDAALFLDAVTTVVETSMDGTSGALYAIFLHALAHGLRAQASEGAHEVTMRVWARALAAATRSLGEYTPAKPGDRTLVDALQPFVEELEANGDLRRAAAAAERGAKKTKGMKARLGRTVYVGGDGYEEVPDPGAHGLAVLLGGFAEGAG